MIKSSKEADIFLFLSLDPERSGKFMPDVYLCGTGGMKPLPDRALTGLWTEHKGTALLIDCGEGMQISLARMGRSLAKLELLLITHFHADHVAGLPGLLLSAGNYGKTSPLTICAPRGGKRIIENICCICGAIPFDINIHELDPEGERFSFDDLEIAAFPLRHRIECFGYSITEHRLPVFVPEKADALGVPLNMRGILHHGGSVEINGRKITPDMVTAQKRPPLKITYITDTVYFEKLAYHAADSDLLVCEGMYGSDEFIPQMREKGHMVFSQSARVARDSHSKELWLTHYSPALRDPFEYESQVKSLFPAAVIGRDGMYKNIK